MAVQIQSKVPFYRPSVLAPYTISGSAGSFILNGSTVPVFEMVGQAVLTGTGAALIGEAATASGITLVTSGGGEYSRELVDQLLRADAAAPEARFNNVVNMLDWLDRD